MYCFILKYDVGSSPHGLAVIPAAHPLPILSPSPPHRSPQSSVQTCNMYICWYLRMCCNASWQNFANMGSPANFIIKARTASNFCARRRSQSRNSLTSTSFPESSQEFENLGQNVIVHLCTLNYMKSPYIIFDDIICCRLRSPRRIHLWFLDQMRSSELRTPTQFDHGHKQT